MNPFDLIVLILSVVSFICGVRRGLVMELSGLIGIFLGVWGAAHFSYIIEGLLAEQTDFQGIGIVAFIITLILIIIAVHLVARLIHRLVGITILSLPNRLLGGAFSLITMAFLLSCVIVIMNSLHLGNTSFMAEARENSVVFPLIEGFAPAIIPYFDLNIGSISIGLSA